MLNQKLATTGVNNDYIESDRSSTRGGVLHQARIPPTYPHQEADIEFLLGSPKVANFSDPGTGKTRTHLESIIRRGSNKRVLVLATKSIMEAAWGNDIKRFTPSLTYAIAGAGKRTAAFDQDVQVVISNHDAVKEILQYKKKFLNGFEELIIDESTAYKNPDARRSRFVEELSRDFPYRRILTGTPTPNGILDLWHQIYLLDQGERLGTKFFAFRAATCDCEMIPGSLIKRWKDKPGIQERLAPLIADITIRRRLEDCIDMPEHVVHEVKFELPSTLMRQYKDLKKHAVVELSSGTLNAINKAVLRHKLLQLAAGSVYVDGQSTNLDDSRYNLIADLAEERAHCLVVFNWKHQRDRLLHILEQRGLSTAVIDGETDRRGDVVDDFQAGKIRCLLVHPQAAGHGLTLTRGTATIWTSPTDNLEHYAQVNRRIYRAGQTERTETIHICAKDTLDAAVYTRCMQKGSDMNDLLSILKDSYD